VSSRGRPYHRHRLLPGELAGPDPLDGPVALQPLPHPGRRRVLKGVALATVPLLLVALAWCYRPKPPVFEHLALVGPRSPVCVRMAIVNDVSGSMQDFAQARERALARLLPWAAAQLRDDDQLAVVDMAENAATKIAPTAIAQVRGGIVSGSAATHDGRYTWLDPVLNQIRGWGPTNCDTGLVLISDAQLVRSARSDQDYTPLPASSGEGRSLELGNHLHSLQLLVPSHDIKVPGTWVTAFPEAMPWFFDGLDETETDEALAHATARLTGQTVAVR
jgi:hypothetical protein